VLHRLAGLEARMKLDFAEAVVRQEVAHRVRKQQALVDVLIPGDFLREFFILARQGNADDVFLFQSLS
jgi:hypothetical protein